VCGTNRFGAPSAAAPPRGTVLALVFLSLLGGRLLAQHDSSVSVPKPSQMHHETDSVFTSVVPQGLLRSCMTFENPTLMAYGEPTARGCLSVAGDTTYFGYVTKDGRFTAVGRTLSPDSESVSRVSADVERSLRLRFGKPSECPLNKWNSPPATRYLQWIKGEYIVQFRTTAGSERTMPTYPKFVSYEIVRGFLACDDWINSLTVN
jgi:hypothetical protein